MDFPARIMALRKGMRLSQERFGELVGMSQRTVAAWESGERKPSLAVLEQVATALGVTPADLLGTETKKQPTVKDDELRAEAIRRVQALPDPALSRVLDFLSGLQAGQEIAARDADGPHPDD